MAAKTKGAANRSIALVAREGEAPARTVARTLSDPASWAASTLSRIHEKAPELDVNAFAAELQSHAREANGGNLSRSEAMLASQATTLDALFHTMVGWAMNHTGDNGNAAYFETCMRLALKAQSQSRATNETLAAIKNPPVVYARQANFAAGHQQVNNGGESRVREIESPPSKLLEAQHGERLDTGTATPAVGVNQTMEAVGAIDRAANSGGQGARCTKRVQGRREAGATSAC